MSVKLSLEGMTQLREALRKLPDDLATEAAVIVEGIAQQAKAEIQAGYPIGPTGNLHNRVTATHNAGRRASASSIVRSSAPHAWIFENGTGRRVTNRGANRGRMPKAPPEQRMIPKVQRLRTIMVRALMTVVRHAGFEVSE